MFTVDVKQQHNNKQQQQNNMYRAVDKRGTDNFSYFSSKPYVVTPHLNRLVKPAQMKGHNIWFYAGLTKIIANCHQRK